LECFRPLYAWYEVVGVDPTDVSYLIAADGLSGTVKVSIDGGDRWNEIPGLTDLVAHRDAGRHIGGFLTAKAVVNGDRTETLVSTISFCPDNPNRVLIGTRQGGTYVSFDHGRNWNRIQGSESMPNTTSVFWHVGCGRAWVSTYGRGIWQLDFNARIVIGSGIRCLLCSLTPYLRNPVPPPSPIEGGVLALDGHIEDMFVKAGKNTVVVSPGSIPLAFGENNFEIVEGVGSTSGPEKDSMQQGIYLEGVEMSAISGHAEIPFSASQAGKIETGSKPYTNTLFPFLRGYSKEYALGAPVLRSGFVLTFKASNLDTAKIYEAIYFDIDGEIIAKLSPDQKEFFYNVERGHYSLGMHFARLSVDGDKGARRILATTNFLIPHEDTD
jgi:hypothetical protein